MKKGIGAFFHSIVYPLIYMGSQAFASVAALFAYFLTIAMSRGLLADELLSDINRLQSEFIAEFSQQILIASCVLTCLIVFIIIKATKRNVRDVFVVRRMGGKKIAVMLLLGVSLNLATVYALSLLPIPEAIIAEYEELVGNAIISDNFWLTFLTTAILVPITEEVVFRGMAFNVLRRGMSLVLAIILQTLLFAGAHMLPLQIAYVIPTSLVLGLVYLWTGNFLAPVLLHVSYNGVSAVLSAIPVTEEAMEGAIENASVSILPFLMMIGAFAVTVICLITIYRGRERKHVSENPIESDGM